MKNTKRPLIIKEGKINYKSIPELSIDKLDGTLIKVMTVDDGRICKVCRGTKDDNAQKIAPAVNEKSLKIQPTC